MLENLFFNALPHNRGKCYRVQLFRHDTVDFLGKGMLMAVVKQVGTFSYDMLNGMLHTARDAIRPSSFTHINSQQDSSLHQLWTLMPVSFRSGGNFTAKSLFRRSKQA